MSSIPPGGSKAKPRLVRPNSAKGSNPADDLMSKLKQNFRKTLIERCEQSTAASRSVKFNPETIDVSIGGTETPGHINMDTTTDTSSMSVSTCSSTSASEHEVSVIEVPPEHRPKVIANRVPSSVPRVGDRFTDSPARKVLASRLQPGTPLSAQRFLDSNGVTATPECYRQVDFETPCNRGVKHRRSSSSELDSTTDEDGSSVTVAVRVRPLSAKEQTKPGMRNVLSMTDNETVVTAENGAVNRFTYDYSFWSCDKTGGIFASQEYVYNTLAQPMLGRAFEGYNVCLFAYGQTGSGKSYSIMGTPAEPGIIPRFCEELFGRISNQQEENLSINVEISFFEIYNEKIHDLLALGNTQKVAPGKRLNLKVREDPVLGPFVDGLSKYVVRSFDDVKGWLSVGNKHRATAATGMNEKSSRSHSVFTMVLTQTRPKARKKKTDWLEGEEHDHSITSKINLVDLAGSERQSHAKTSGDRLRQEEISKYIRREGASINKSLHTLGKVISLLSEQSNSQNKKKKIFIPYRDSVLTWLLKESLGGNAKTTMLATVGPSDSYIEETLSTLRYANQARSIINVARVNEDSNARLIRELRAEIDKLRTQTGTTSLELNGKSSLAEIVALREKLSAKEHEMAEMTKSWQERLMRSEERKAEEARLLEQSGISFQADNSRPSLVNLNEDPQLSEQLLYILKDGKTHIGRKPTGLVNDIQLHGPLIAETHCLIECVKNTVSVIPEGEAPTYVNGTQITSRTVLHHGDRVILGGDHYYRLNHPVEAQSGRKSDFGSTPSRGTVKDFEYAKAELMRVQDAKLQEELEAAKRKHLEEMEQKLECERSVAQQQLEREVARKRQEAEAELRRQQQEYERRLAELEKALWDQKAEHQETEQDRRRAQQRIRTLEREKDMLESEVLSNMKKLEEDARASQKNMAESRHQHSRLVDQLERERQKIKKDVERIEQIRSRRGNTPSTPRFTPAKQQSSETLYRFTLLLREANKISQHFKKDVTYSFEMVGQGDEGQTLIKVVNTKLNISTFWPRHKFEERLVHMRELFNSCEPEAYSADIDDVFCDVNDMWGKSDRGVSPKILENLRKKPGTRSRLSFDSASSVDSLRSGAMESPLVTATEQKSPVEMESVDPPPLEMPTVSSLCRDLISSALHRFTDSALQESVADKILLHCEVIKGCIATTLEAFNNATEAGVQRSVFVESPAMRINSIQITSHLEVLLSQSALWVGSYESLTSGLIRDLCMRIVMTARKLGSQIILFLQGCENDLDTLVQESAGQALSSVFALSKQCGELALATETAMICLTTPAARGSTDSDDDVEITTPIKVGDDVRQSFLSGCDVFIDKTIHGGLRTVEECELRIQNLTDDMSQNMPVDVEEVAQQVALTTACAKTMLMRCQQLQVDLDSTVQDTLMETKPDAYYGRSYQRAQGLISHITNLTDTVTHFTQASTSYLRGSDLTELRKVARCAELIQKSAMKLLSTSNSDPASNTSSSFSDSVDVSLLSESCVEHLDVAAHEVKEATNSLITLIKRNLDREPSPPTPVRGKRVLPPSPVKGTGVTRRNSFSERTAQQKVHALRKAFENGS